VESLVDTFDFVEGLNPHPIDWLVKESWSPFTNQRPIIDYALQDYKRPGSRSNWVDNPHAPTVRTLLRNDWIDTAIGGPTIAGQFTLNFGIPDPTLYKETNDGFQRVRMAQLNIMVRFLNMIEPEQDPGKLVLLGPNYQWGGPQLNMAVYLSSKYVLQHLSKFHLSISGNLDVVNSMLTGMVINRDYGTATGAQALERAAKRVDYWISRSGVGIRLSLGSGVLQGHPSGSDWTSFSNPTFSDRTAQYPPYFPGSTIRQDYSRRSVAVKYSVDGIEWDPEGYLSYYELKQ